MVYKTQNSGIPSSINSLFQILRYCRNTIFNLFAMFLNLLVTLLISYVAKRLYEVYISVRHFTSSVCGKQDMTRVSFRLTASTRSYRA